MIKSLNDHGSKSDALPDVQKESDGRKVRISSAGVCNLHYPLSFSNQGKVSTVDTTCSLATPLSPSCRGVNMSRFLEFLKDWSKEAIEDFHFEEVLRNIETRLESEGASLELSFSLFTEKTSPKTGLTAPMAFQVRVYSKLKDNKLSQVFRIDTVAGNLCPCSKAISDNGAHAQRVRISAEIELEPSATLRCERFTEVASLLQKQGSNEVFPILKRPDEKAVTETQYANPKFVEDVARDAFLALKELPELKNFKVRAEAEESIHAHNAYCEINSLDN